MPEHEAWVVILTEDSQSAVFLRRFLLAIGLTAPRKIQPVFAPPGRGSGEKFVREAYARELRSYRAKAAHRATKLVAMIDADTLTVEARLRQVESTGDPEAAPRRDDEAVAILIPRRNVETWIRYLAGQPVDEERAYPKLDRERDCQPAVDRLVAWYRKQEDVPPDCPDSLRRGVEELRRVL